MDTTISWFGHRYSPITPRKFKLSPNVSQRLGEMIHQLMAVIGGDGVMRSRSWPLGTVG
jgi:hypothetical protein